MGIAYVKLGKFEKAIDVEEQRLAHARRYQYKQYECSALLGIARGHSALGNYVKAIETYRSAIQIACEMKDPHAEGSARVNLAWNMILARHKPVAASLEMSWSGLQLLQQVEASMRQRDDSEKIRLLETQSLAYGAVQESLMHMEEEECAMAVAGASKARALAHWIETGPGLGVLPDCAQSMPTSFNNCIAQAVVEVHREWVQVKDIIRAEGCYIVEYSMLAPGNWMRVWVVSETGTLLHSEIMSTAAEEVDGFSWDLEELLSLAEAAIETGGWTWFDKLDIDHRVRRRGTKQEKESMAVQGWLTLHFQGTSSNGIQKLAKEVTSWQELLVWGAGRPVDPIERAAKQKVLSLRDMVLRELHRRLMGPVANALESAREVLIVPHRHLFRVPWPALCDKDGVHLIQRHLLRVTPSLRVAAHTRELRSMHKLESQHALVVGNPWPIKQPNPPEQLPSLKFAEEEAGMASRSLQKVGQVITLTGTEANCNAVKSSLSGAGWVHLACHGDVHKVPRAVGEAGVDHSLFLASDANCDGVFSMADVRSLKVAPGATVMLSCCQSGLGEMLGEGVIGLSRAFFAAGAGALVVSVCRIPDKATAHLMQAFYSLVFERGYSVAEAMRQAVLQEAQLPDLLPVCGVDDDGVCQHPRKDDEMAFTTTTKRDLDVQRARISVGSTSSNTAEQDEKPRALTWYDWGGFLVLGSASNVPSQYAKHSAPAQSFESSAPSTGSQSTAPAAVDVRMCDTGVTEVDVRSTTSRLDRLGNALSDKAELEHALVVYQRSLDVKVASQAFGPDHVETGKSHMNLAATLVDLDSLHEAKVHCNKALEIFGKHNGSHQTDTAKVYFMRAQCHLAVHRSGAAYEDFALALSMYESEFTREHVLAVQCILGLGLVHGMNSDHHKALELYHEGLTLLSKIGGTTRLEVMARAKAFQMIGTSHAGRREMESALSNFEQSLALQLSLEKRDIGTTQNPEVASILMYIGSAHASIREFPEALTRFEQALHIRRKCFSSEHPEVAQVLDAIARAHEHQTLTQHLRVREAATSEASAGTTVSEREPQAAAKQSKEEEDEAIEVFSVELTDTDGNVMLFLLTEGRVSEYINGVLKLESVERVRIEARTGTVNDAKGQFTVIANHRPRLCQLRRLLVRVGASVVELDGQQERTAAGPGQDLVAAAAAFLDSDMGVDSDTRHALAPIERESASIESSAMGTLLRAGCSSTPGATALPRPGQDTKAGTETKAEPGHSDSTKVRLAQKDASAAACAQNTHKPDQEPKQPMKGPGTGKNDSQSFEQPAPAASNIDQDQRESCSFCDSGEQVRSCKGCRVAMYCCAECQRRDWPRHRPTCQLVARAHKGMENASSLSVRDAVRWLRLHSEDDASGDARSKSAVLEVLWRWAQTLPDTQLEKHSFLALLDFERSMAFISLGHFHQAIEPIERLLELARSRGDRVSEGENLGNLGNVYHSLGDFSKALELHGKHLAIAKETRNSEQEGAALEAAGLAHDALGDTPAAVASFQSALIIWQAMGDVESERKALSFLQYAYDKQELGTQHDLSGCTETEELEAGAIEDSDEDELLAAVLLSLDDSSTPSAS